MKTILITGVSRGIGKALAEKFLEMGDEVIGTSTSGNIDWSHDHIKVFQLDLSQPASIEKCVGEINLLNKNIDILINNAAVWSGNEDDPIVHTDFLRKTLEVNVIGTADFTERIIHLIKEGGHILNISSRAGSLGYVKDAEYPDYKISKAALNMLTRVLAIRLTGHIIVSSVHPGWVKTDMGGEDADIEPKQAAEHIYNLAKSNIETGQFWFEGKKFPW